MKMLMRVMLAILVVSTVTSAADTKDKQKQEDRLKNSATVMDEILHVPDNIPQDLLDKAKCVIVIPSVVKAAFIVGGELRSRDSWFAGSGKNSFRSMGNAFHGLCWKAEVSDFRSAERLQNFVLLVMNEHGVNRLAAQQSKNWRRHIRGSRTR